MIKPDIALIGCGAAAKRYYVPAIQNNLDKLGNLYLVDKETMQAEQVRLEMQKGEVIDNYPARAQEAQQPRNAFVVIRRLSGPG